MRTYTCQQCGKAFPSRHTENNPQFCSRQCSNASRHKRATLTCQECGNPFETLPCYLPRSYCGKACAAKANNRNYPRPYKPAHNRILDHPLTGAEKAERRRHKKYAQIESMPKIPCACGCGTLIPPINKTFVPARYVRGHNPTPPPPVLRAEQHPFWKGGKSFEPYPIIFNNTLKKDIRERDNYRCQMCGKEQSWFRYRLAIHHIDYNKDNCDPMNLISLCSKCHGKIHFNRTYWQSYFAALMQERFS